MKLSEVDPGLLFPCIGRVLFLKRAHMQADATGNKQTADFVAPVQEAGAAWGEVSRVDTVVL